MLNVAKRILYSFFYKLDKRSWKHIEYFDPSWLKRVEKMAAYIASGASVLDLGCGKMWLRQYLKDNAYYPVDYTDRGQGTIVCDFNKKQFPAQHADVGFVSGTLEYVADAEWFISSIAKNCSQCVISYCPREDYPDLDFRRKQAWVNDYSRDDIIAMFYEAGFRLESESLAIPRNRIFNFLKTSSHISL